MAENKTEKATPKRKEEARKKGQVARSADVNGAVVLMASLLALSAFGPGMWERMAVATRDLLMLTSSPDVVSREGIGELMRTTGTVSALAVAPIAVVCALAGLIASVAQVGLKPAPAAMKPDFKKINPLTGAKNLFGPQHLIFETVEVADQGRRGRRDRRRRGLPQALRARGSRRHVARGARADARDDRPATSPSAPRPPTS